MLLLREIFGSTSAQEYLSLLVNKLFTDFFPPAEYASYYEVTIFPKPAIAILLSLTDRLAPKD